MTETRQIEPTADGYFTLYAPEIDEHYHSINGAVQESEHVYINAGLKQLTGELSILEIGFGTGLNAYLTLLHALKMRQKIAYTAIELYPLTADIINSLNYTSGKLHEEAACFTGLHEAEWNRQVAISPFFSLEKRLTDLTRPDGLDMNERFDLIYFDAFAPDKQPEMWTQAVFDRLYGLTKSNGVLVTYCAKGIIRRTLQQAGYWVERLQGPRGKREMLRATKKTGIIKR
jgi:tRNA U34 5-methylaminomethyl-2-thiouridine-forming methyltransferase MnmC